MGAFFGQGRATRRRLLRGPGRHRGQGESSDLAVLQEYVETVVKPRDERPMAELVPGGPRAAGRVGSVLICRRHHSPAAALQVERLIQARRPRAVLVEGPADATRADSPAAGPGDRAAGGDSMPTGRRRGARGLLAVLPSTRPSTSALRAGQEVGRTAGVLRPASGHHPRMDAQMPDDSAPGWDPTEMLTTWTPLRRRRASTRSRRSGRRRSSRRLPPGSPADYMALLAEFGERSRLLSHPEPEHQTRLREPHMAMRRARSRSGRGR